MKAPKTIFSAAVALAMSAGAVVAKTEVHWWHAMGGTPIDLYDKPETIFVAGFIGSPSMNFIPASSQKGSLILGNGIKISKFKDDHEALTVGIRPEHLEPNEKGQVRVCVQMVEQLGAKSLVHGVLEKTNIEFSASIPGQVTADAGPVMAFDVNQENIHIFHADTGKRISK